jgi:hypothetical protein
MLLQWNEGENKNKRKDVRNWQTNVLDEKRKIAIEET